MLISYAQNFEDVILWRALKHVGRGFYIDVGAQDPVIDSVSLAFYEQGWRGVHVEPIHSFAQKLRATRPDEEVIEAAVANKKGSLAFFAIADTGLSTGNASIAQKHKRDDFKVEELNVACLPLGELLDRYRDRDIHWLKIDVEGMEGEVIESWAPSNVRPWIVIVESTLPTSSEPNYSGWEPSLLRLGYDFVYFDGLNRFYVSSRHAELRTSFGPGPNYFDDFCLAPVAWTARLARREFESAQNELASIRQVLVGKEAELAGTRTALVAAQSILAKQRAMIASTTVELARTKMALADKDDMLAEREAMIGNLEAAIRAEREQYAASVVAARTEVAAISKRLQEWTSQANDLRQELQAVRASTSWRITRPLRAVKRGIELFVKGFASSRRSLYLAFRLVLRKILEPFLAMVRRRIWMKKLVAHLIAVFPVMDRHLRAFARARAPTQPLVLTDESFEAPQLVSTAFAGLRSHQESLHEITPLQLRAEEIYQAIKGRLQA